MGFGGAGLPPAAQAEPAGGNDPLPGGEAGFPTVPEKLTRCLPGSRGCPEYLTSPTITRLPRGISTSMLKSGFALLIRLLSEHALRL